MKYSVNVKSYEDLKFQYRVLALANHPDVGGDSDTMKAINNEYDALFPSWKHRAAVTNNETAENTRSEFYTANGWKGDNYNCNITTKEIAQIIREYVKDVHNDYRFSIRYESYSGGSSFTVTMTEAPTEALTNGKTEAQLNQYNIDCDKRITEAARAVMADINKVIVSYRMDDSDGMIDYFHTNFYYNLNIGTWDKPYKIVPRTKKAAANVEYETVEVTKTRKYKTLEPRDIETPAEIQAGQYFQLKSNFNNGHYRGAVYCISSAKNYFGSSYKMGKGYKNMRTGNTRGNCFCASPETLRKWAEKGALRFVELVEVEKTEEYTSSVRRPKKQTGLSTEVQNRNEAAAQQNSSATVEQDYTITPDTDTRDNSPLWVLRINRTLDREEYKTVAERIKEIKGYYSKFKRGFIFRYDPADTLQSII